VILFFQAEDGIRDRNVTGVQTCALPILAMIYSALMSSSLMVLARPRLMRMGFLVLPSSFKSSKFCMFRAPTWITSTSSNRGRWRSEERRVGKERRAETEQRR